MRIGILSDTHDRLPTFRAALDLLIEQKVDAIFHAGDYIAPFAAKILIELAGDLPLHCIYGNNDGERPGLKKVLPDIQDGPYRVELAGKVVVMHHFLDWLTTSDLKGADMVISGHDHEPKVETRDGVLYVNPGECCGWLSGRCTVAIADLDTMDAEILDVDA